MFFNPEEKNIQQLNDSIDELIMIVKERIERWDIPSVRFSTKETFLRLYKYAEESELNLYSIYEDLFRVAYSQRKHILGVMIQVFYFILFESWVPRYDVEKAEKASEVLLRLGLDFLNKDFAITKDCFISIDNLAGDMFEPEILSKEILSGASAFEKMTENPKLRGFVEQLVDWVRINDQYAWDAGIKTYLRDSIQYAEWEQERYDMIIKNFKQKYLLPALEQNINEDIEGYIQFLGELESEGDEDISFPAEELARMILSHEFLRPQNC